MTPAELKAARQTLGLSANGLAKVLQIASGRTVQRWEAGDSEIPGPVQVLLKLILSCMPARKALGL